MHGSVCARGASCYKSLTICQKMTNEKKKENEIDSEDKDVKFVAVATVGL